MAVSEISMVRKLPRKKNSTPATKNRSHQQLHLQVAERGLDEVGLAENTCGALMPAGRLLPSCRPAPLQAPGQIHGIGRRLFLDAEDDGRAGDLPIVETAVAALDRGEKTDLGHLAQQNGLPGPCRQRDVL